MAVRTVDLQKFPFGQIGQLEMGEEFKIVFDTPLTEEVLQEKFWEDDKLYFVKYTYNYSEKDWDQTEMKFESTGGFTAKQFLDALCLSEQEFRQDRPDGNHIFLEGWSEVGPLRLSVFWGS